MNLERKNSIFSDADLLDMLAALVSLQGAVGGMVFDVTDPDRRAQASAAHSASVTLVDDLLKRLGGKNHG